MKKATKKKTDKKNTVKHLYYYDLTISLEAFSKDEAKKILKELEVYYSKKTPLPKRIEIQCKRLRVEILCNQLSDVGPAKLSGVRARKT